MPNPFLESVLRISQRLAERGIPSWSHGDALLHEMRTIEADTRSTDSIRAPRALLCDAEPEELIAALPQVVVTASNARRVTLATKTGPIDLQAIGRGKLEERLLDFGLSVFAFAYDPATESWCDPIGARAQFDAGVLDLARETPNPFGQAPRRYWIAARILATYQLKPASRLCDAARDALPEALANLPQAAPARRELSTILHSIEPSAGLSFLREVGVTGELFPGLKASSDRQLEKLPSIAALRWSVWLNGTPIQRALVRLRMPHDLARKIERIHRAHPIDHSVNALREAGVRKILQRLEPDEIEGLIAWRRLELEAAPQNEETQARTSRLSEVERRLAEFRAQRIQTSHVRALALDGQAVMQALGAGPGPHVGRALAHLARFVADDPESNEPEILQTVLRGWRAQNQGDIP